MQAVKQFVKDHALQITCVGMSAAVVALLVKVGKDQSTIRLLSSQKEWAYQTDEFCKKVFTTLQAGGSVSLDEAGEVVSFSSLS